MYALLLAPAFVLADSASAEHAVRIYAAGSLRAAITEIAQAASSVVGFPVATP